jgi:hypothetical protein
MKRVLVIEASDRTRFSLAVAGGTVTIGPNPVLPELAFDNLHVLRVYCEVEVADDMAVISPSTPDAAGADGRQELRAGNDLQVGHAYVRLDPIGEEDEPGAASPSAAHPVAAATTPAPASCPRKQLLVIDGADYKQAFHLPEAGTISIGNSGKHADVCLHDFYVSRVHCQVTVQGDTVSVAHSEGKNGTLVNGQRITQTQELRLGDVLRVGNSHLRLELAEDGGRPATAADAPATGVAARTSPPLKQTGGTATAALAETRPQLGLSGQSDVPVPPDALGTLEGQVLGRYRVGPLLGTGHAGAVFHAQDVKTNQIVALKVLAPEFPANPAELQAFAQALKTATPLHHPNLINLLGAGKNGPYCWIAREYVEGDSVAVLVQRYKEENKLTWARAVRVAIHLAKALAFLHEHKVVHRNITPRNILVVDADKMTKLTDLMLTTALAGSRLQKTIMEKKLLSELPYQAPEQVEPDAFVDHLADMYALGAVVYTLTTGEPPFSGTSPEDVIAKIRTTPVMRPTRFQRKLPFAYEGVVLKLLAKRQEDRYQTASELLADLEVLAQEHQISV